MRVGVRGHWMTFLQGRVDSAPKKRVNKLGMHNFLCRPEGRRWVY